MERVAVIVRIMVIFRVMVKFRVMDKFRVNVKVRVMERVMEIVAMKIPIVYSGALSSRSGSWEESWNTETIESRSWSRSRYNTNSGQGGKESNDPQASPSLLVPKV